jgi:predicted HTH transcriptional regulator
MTTLLVRKYHHQLRDMPKLSIDRRRAAEDLRELIASGEGTHLEFKSTMRMNLYSKVMGREIEMAWLKAVAAFLNSEGGILLLGVSDDGTVLGLDADKFENEDKCRLHFKNLLNHHIGAEYARFVRFELYNLDDLRVGAVECERSDMPAFLHDDKSREMFIIRNGPSNIELSISRALRYIRSRF